MRRVFALLGNLVDYQSMRAIADIILARNRDALSRKWQQSGILRSRRRFVIDGHKDCAIISQQHKRRAILCASLRAGHSNWLVETLGIGTRGVENPACESDIRAAIRGHGETSQRCECSRQQLTSRDLHFATSKTEGCIDGV